MHRWTLAAAASLLVAIPALADTSDRAFTCRVRAGTLERTSADLRNAAREVERRALACHDPELASALSDAAAGADVLRGWVAGRPDDHVLGAPEVTRIRRQIGEIHAAFRRMRFPEAMPCRDELLEQTRQLHTGPFEALGRGAASSMIHTLIGCGPTNPFCNYIGFIGDPAAPDSDAPYCGEPSAPPAP